MRLTGTGAAPLMTQRRSLCLCFAGSWIWRMNPSMAGTMSPVLTRSESMISHALAGSNVRMRTWVTPLYVHVRTGVSAPTWNIGIGLMYRSPRRKSAVAAIVSTDHSCVSCECITPFGRPVVPDVYMM